MKRVLCLLADGFEDIEAVAVIDLLKRAGISVDLLGINKKVVESSSGISYLTTMSFSDVVVSDYDMLFVPGGKGVSVLLDSEDVINLVNSFDSKKKYISAICAGPLVLNKANLLDGVEFTCYPSIETQIKNGIHIDKGVVVSNRITTGKGIGYVFDFSLSLIETLVGTDIKDKVKSSTLIK